MRMNYLNSDGEAAMTENRMERLASDYEEMLKIQDRPYLRWIATKGELPYAEEYLLDIRVRTYALCAREHEYVVGTIYRCTVKVTLWDSYPHIAPSIRMLDLPPVFHPDWYSKGAYCSSEPWRPAMSLKDHILRMIGTLTYAPSLTRTATPANYKALDWYLRNCGKEGWFPSDRIELSENSIEQTAAIRDRDVFGEVIDSWPIG